jgi:hypothetical protein
LDSAIFSDVIQNIVFWLGVTLFSLTIVLFILILAMRHSFIQKRHHKQQVIKKWLPLLQQAEAQEFPDSVPTLAPNDVLLFLSLWINLYEVANEGSRETLVIAAIQAGIGSLSIGCHRHGVFIITQRAFIGRNVLPYVYPGV